MGSIQERVFFDYLMETEMIEDFEPVENEIKTIENREYIEDGLLNNWEPDYRLYLSSEDVCLEGIVGHV